MKLLNSKTTAYNYEWINHDFHEVLCGHKCSLNLMFYNKTDNNRISVHFIIVSFNEGTWTFPPKKNIKYVGGTWRMLTTSKLSKRWKVESCEEKLDWKIQKLYSQGCQQNKRRTIQVKSVKLKARKADCSSWLRGELASILRIDSWRSPWFTRVKWSQSLSTRIPLICSSISGVQVSLGKASQPKL